MLIYILLIVIGITIFFDSKNSLHMLQQNLYNENNRYLKWVGKNYKIYFNFQILALVIILISTFVLIGMEDILTAFLILLIVLYAIEIYRMYQSQKNSQQKEP